MPQPDTTIAQLLHTAARRYCIAEYNRWMAHYAQLCRTGKDRVDNKPTDEALRTYPRYNILRVILTEIERLEPNEFTSVDEVLELLLRAGESAPDAFTNKPSTDIAANAIAEQRGAFAAYLRTLTPEHLASIEPLPYRRVMNQSETASIWNRLRERWSIGSGYWYPLEESPCADIVAFQEHFVLETVGRDLIQQFLRERGVPRVWKFCEFSEHGYIMDIEFFDPVYGGDGEEFWSSPELDWILYVSHEASVTIGGWLIQRIKDRFHRSWPKHIWKDAL